MPLVVTRDVVTATWNTPHDDRPLRVEVIYDQERARMKIIIVGDLERGAELFRVIGFPLEAKS